MKSELDASRAHTMLLSCEGFWRLDDSNVARLAGLTSEFNSTVILYVRDPVDHLKSGYRQGIKKGKTRESFEKWVEARKGQLDYLRLSERWKKHFEIEILHYEDEKDELVPRFMARFGIQTDSNEPRNVTPDEEKLRTILWVNRAEPLIGNRVAKALRRRLLRK